jgi:hypothetical protein
MAVLSMIKVDGSGTTVFSNSAAKNEAAVVVGCTPSQKRYSL